MTDRRSLSRTLNVTAGSGIWDSEGGATDIFVQDMGGYYFKALKRSPFPQRTNK